MRQFNLRIDDALYDHLLKKSKERGIKVTRFARMLIEQGLVIDHQLHTQETLPNRLSQDSNLLAIIANFTAETVMLTRYLYREHFEKDEDFKAKATKIYQQSQQLLELVKQEDKDSALR